MNFFLPAFFSLFALVACSSIHSPDPKVDPPWSPPGWRAVGPKAQSNESFSQVRAYKGGMALISGDGSLGRAYWRAPSADSFQVLPLPGPGRVNSLAVSEDTLWFGMDSLSTIHGWDGTTWTTRVLNPFPHHRVELASNGSKLAAALSTNQTVDRFVYVLQDGRIDTLAKGLPPDNAFADMEITSDGNIWGLSYDEGIFRWRDSVEGWVVVPAPVALDPNYMAVRPRSLTEHKGGLFIGYFLDRVYQLHDDGRWESLHNCPSGAGAKAPFFTFALASGGGYLWAAGREQVGPLFWDDSTKEWNDPYSDSWYGLNNYGGNAAYDLQVVGDTIYAATSENLMALSFTDLQWAIDRDTLIVKSSCYNEGYDSLDK